MKRFDCLKSLAPLLDDKTIVVTNVGPICREWNALRPSDANLLQVNLGLCAAVGLGVAVSLPHRQVVMLDGDGNLLLNLASLADLANQNLKNVVHIVLNKESYARGAEIEKASVVTNTDELRGAARAGLTNAGHHFIVAKVEKGSVSKLPTLTIDGKEGKYRFARYIETTENVQILRPRHTHI